MAVPWPLGRRMAVHQLDQITRSNTKEYPACHAVPRIGTPSRWRMGPSPGFDESRCAP